MNVFKEYVFIILLILFALGLAIISSNIVSNVNGKEYNIGAKVGQ